MSYSIPEDWDGQTFVDYSVNWPNSPQWRILLRGLITEPNLIEFWDATEAEIEQVLLEIAPSVHENVILSECEPMTIPVGTISLYAGETAPDGWLFCNGQTAVRAGFPDLFAVIGTTYGAPSADTFKLPDLRGRVPVGFDMTGQPEFDVLGETGGEKDHTLTAGEMPSHTHTQNSHTHTQNSHNHTQNSHNHTQNSHTHNIPYQSAGVNGTAAWKSQSTVQGNVDIDSGVAATNIAATATNMAATATNMAATATNQNAGGDGPHNNLQPYLVLNFIIRAEL